MLQSLRDNLKGTVAVIVIAIFAVPMVLFGVEQLFVGSLGGNEVAKVDDTTISRAELNRAVYLQKQRILSQSDVDPNSDFLKDENLRGPVLESLTRHAALVNAAQKGGMSVSEVALWQEIAQQPQFQDDGSFSSPRFRQLIGSMGYTTATYLKALGEGVMVNQQNDGVSSSGFLTQADLAQFVSLAQQTRSYFNITIPAAQVREAIEVSDQDIATFYEQNESEFRLPERVALNYIEVDLDTLAERERVDEEDLRAQYEQEMATFDAQPQYDVSHILIEPENKEKVDQVQQALAEGRSFAEVASEFSDDLGSSDNGGSLGKLIVGVYPEPFEKAVHQLEQGEISKPVETEAGIHFIKADRKVIPAKPSFADRKDDIERQLRRSLAEQKMATIRERMDELTYSASNLQKAAEELDLDIKKTDLFSRNSGQGLTGHRAVQEAAFSNDVLKQGHNSPVLELPINRLVVVRVAEHEPERVQPLADVKEQVQTRLRKTKTDQRLAQIGEQIIARIRQGEPANEIAAAEGYSYTQKAKVSRSDADVDRILSQRLFSMPRPVNEQPVLETMPLSNGDYAVVGLTAVVPGDADSLEEAQKVAMRSQLVRQLGTLEASSYEDHVVSSADIQME